MMNRYCSLILLVLLSAMMCFGAVSKKRFGVPVYAPEPSVVETLTAEEPHSCFWDSFAGVQKELREKVSSQIALLKKGNNGSVFTFLLICLVYGMLHALGPGHGKSIVVGYLLARRGTLRQGMALGASITLTHTLSAVILLFALYGILKAAVFPTFEIGRNGIENASYVLVMLTGILLVIFGIKDFLKKEDDARETQMGRNASWREIVTVALVTGIVPCPAVALVVLFCLLNSMVSLALSGALFICIGMMLTNMLFGIGAVFLKKGVDRGASKTGAFARNIHVIATLVGGCVVFFSGLLLMTGTFIGKV